MKKWTVGDITLEVWDDGGMYLRQCHGYIVIDRGKIDEFEDKLSQAVSSIREEYGNEG